MEVWQIYGGWQDSNYGRQMNGRCELSQEGKWRILLLTSLVEKRPRYVSQSIALPQSRVRVSLPIYATKDRIQMQNIWNHINSWLCKSHLRTFPNLNNKSICAAWRPNVLLKKVLWLHLAFFVKRNEENTAQCAFWELRWPCGQNGPVYATGPYYVAHVVDTGP